MKRPTPFNVAGVAVGLCLGAAATPALAVPAKARPTKPPTETTQQKLSGVWISLAFRDYRAGPPVGAEGGGRGRVELPLQPWTAAALAERRAPGPNNEPYAGLSGQCMTAGMPAVTGTPDQQPVEFIQAPEQGQIAILLEYFNVFRVVHMNGAHPADFKPTLTGHSIGRWEGDALVIDTVGISTLTDVRGGIPHSPELRVTERIRWTGLVLENQVTVEDPKAFTKPWSWMSYLKPAPKDIKVREWICENNRNAPGEDGRTNFQLQSGGPPS